MSSKIYEVAYKLGAKLDSRYKKTFTQAENIASKSMKNIAKIATTALATLSIASFVVSGTQGFIDLENKMNEVFTLLPGISAQAMDDMTRQARQASVAMGTMPEETIPAMYQALSAGVPKDNVFKFLEDSNKMAVGGLATLEESVGLLTTVVNNYGADVISSQTASDLLFKTVAKGVTTIPELASSLGNVLPAANSANISMSQVSATMATLTATMGAGSTSQAGTAMVALFSELSSSSTGTYKNFKELAGKSFPEFMAAGGDLNQALEIMQKGADKTGVAVGDMFSSVESKKAVNILTSNSATFVANLEEMQNAAGATQAAYDQMSQSLSFKLKKLSVWFNNVKLSVGSFVAGILVVAVEKFELLRATIGEKVNKVLEENALKIALLKGSFKGLMTSLSLLGKTIFSNVGYNFENIASVVIPKVINILILLISKAQSVVKFFITNWGSISTAIDEVSNKAISFGSSIAVVASKIWESVGPLIESIAKTVVKNIPVALAVLATLLDAAKGVADFIANNWTFIEPLLAGIIGGFVAFKAISTVFIAFFKIVNLVKTGVTLLSTAIAFLTSPIGLVVLAIGALIAVGVLLYRNWDTIKQKAQELWDKIGSFITDISERFPILGSVIAFVKDYISTQIGNIKLIFSGVIDFIAGVFSGDWSRAWTGIVNVFSGIFSSISEYVKAPLNAVIALVNGVIESINGLNIQIPDWVPKLGAQTFGLNIPQIPAFAKGTNDSPSTFIAGEKGAELVTNRQHSKIFTALETGNIFKTLANVGNKNSNLSGVTNATQNTQGTSPSVQVNYSPSINVNGSGANEEQLLALIEQALAKDKESLKKIIKQVVNDIVDKDKRLSNA